MKTSLLNNLFIFKESEKSLKKTPSGFLFMMSGFNEPEKKQKQLVTLILGLKSTIEVSKLALDEFFHFMEV